MEVTFLKKGFSYPLPIEDNNGWTVQKLEEDSLLILLDDQEKQQKGLVVSVKEMKSYLPKRKRNVKPKV